MYGKKLHTLLLVFFLSLPVLPVRAQESLGLFNSPKGFGAQVRLAERNGVFHSAVAFIDIYGVPTSRCSNPGIRVNVSRDYIVSRRRSGDVTTSFYAGPGITLGYLRDHDKGRGIDMDSLFGNKEGVAIALSGNGGCRFDFDGPVSLDLSFMADLGVHIRRNEVEKGYFATNLSIFNNGIMQAFYPQLTILFRL